MPYVFFKNAGTFFKLALDPSGWNRNTLLDLIDRCGYSVLDSINATLEECARQEFCAGAFLNPYGQPPTQVFDQLTLSTSNQSDISVWKCILNKADKYPCRGMDIAFDLCIFLFSLVSLLTIIIWCECERRDKTNSQKILSLYHAQERQALIEDSRLSYDMIQSNPEGVELLTTGNDVLRQNDMGV